MRNNGAALDGYIESGVGYSNEVAKMRRRDEKDRLKKLRKEVKQNVEDQIKDNKEDRKQRDEVTTPTAEEGSHDSTEAKKSDSKGSGSSNMDKDRHNHKTVKEKESQLQKEEAREEEEEEAKEKRKKGLAQRKVSQTPFPMIISDQYQWDLSLLASFWVLRLYAHIYNHSLPFRASVSFSFFFSSNCFYSSHYSPLLTLSTLEG